MGVMEYLKNLFSQKLFAQSITDVGRCTELCVIIWKGMFDVEGCVYQYCLVLNQFFKKNQLAFKELVLSLEWHVILR